jgi:protein involved in polysaccharide export with SLBB domain
MMKLLSCYWGRINEEYSLKVQKNGRLIFPESDRLLFSGLNFETMRKNISDQISKIEGVNVNCFVRRDENNWCICNW